MDSAMRSKKTGRERKRNYRKPFWSGNSNALLKIKLSMASPPSRDRTQFKSKGRGKIKKIKQTYRGYNWKKSFENLGFKYWFCFNFYLENLKLFLTLSLTSFIQLCPLGFLAQFLITQWCIRKLNVIMGVYPLANI